MPCRDCFNNCGTTRTSDQCVEYTGLPNTVLNICTGDQLSSVEANIIAALLTALDGSGIQPTALTLANCSWLSNLFTGKTPTLLNYLQLLIDNTCALNTRINALVPGSYSFNTSCLTGLPTTPGPNDILQASLNLLCSIQTTVNAIPATYVKSTDLPGLVNGIISNSSTTVAIYNQRMVPYVAMPYFGPLSNFDSSGIGLAANGYTKVYICNGANGTPDMRGRTIVGAVRNIPGGSLDAAVDPVNPANPNTNYAIGDKFGENYHTLTGDENGPHTHVLNDPGHTHPINMGTLPQSGSSTQVLVDINQSYSTPPIPKTITTGLNYSGVSINSAGSGTPHNTRQPSIAGCWIMYIP